MRHETHHSTGLPNQSPAGDHFVFDRVRGWASVFLVAATVALSTFATDATFATDNAPKPDPDPNRKQPALAPVPTIARELRETLAKMREIEQRIAKGDTSPDTQQLEQQVVDQLRRLLKQAGNTRPPSQNSGGSPPGQPQGGNPSQSDGNPSQPAAANDEGEDAKEASADSTQSPEAGNIADNPQSDPSKTKTAGDKGSESSEQLRPNAEARAAAERKALLAQEVWGHLPEKLRQELLSGYNERMLPQYESAIRKYYDGLARPVNIRSK